MVRILPPSVDDLRTKTNQKQTYGNMVVPGQRGGSRPILGKQEKRTADTFVVDRPTAASRSQLTAMPKQAPYELQPTARDVAAATTGTIVGVAANASLGNAASLYSYTEEPFRNFYTSPNPGPASGSVKVQPYYDPNDVAKDTTRQTTEHLAFGVGSTFSGPVTLGPTTTTEEEIRSNRQASIVQQPAPTGSLAGTQVGYSVDYSDVPDWSVGKYPVQPPVGATHCEAGGTVAYTSYPGERSDRGGALKEFDTTFQPSEPVAISSYTTQPPVVNYNELLDTTLRETIPNPTAGNISAGPAIVAWDPHAQVDTTIRETTGDFMYEGPSTGASTTLMRAWDEKDVAKTTVRDTTTIGDADLKHGVFMGPSVQYAYNPNDIPDITMKETQNNHINGPAPKNEGEGYKTTKQHAPVTQRQLTTNTSYYSSGSSVMKRPTAFDPNGVSSLGCINDAFTNMEFRPPTTVGLAQIPTKTTTLGTVKLRTNYLNSTRSMVPSCSIPVLGKMPIL